MSFVGIITLVVVVIVVAVLITLGIILTRSSQHNGEPEEHPKGGKEMIKTLYTYLILFATLMMTIGGSVAAFMAIADLIAPSSYYMTFEDYKRSAEYGKPMDDSQQVSNKSEEQLREEYQALVEAEKRRSQERALNSLIKSFGWIVIPLPVFLYYQRRLRTE